MDKKSCSVVSSSSYSKNNISCLSDKLIDKLWDFCNYEIRKQPIFEHMTIKEKYYDLTQMMKEVPENMWVEDLKNNKFVTALRKNSKLHKEISLQFKPRLSKNKTWLSSDNIDDVLHRYSAVKSNKFAYLNAIPPTKNWAEKFIKHVYRYWDTHTYFACVLNTSTESGVHWVAVFIEKSDDEYEGSLEYFDSFGNAPSEPILSSFWDPVVEEFDGELIPFYNTTKHQQSDVECGMYAIWYITTRLEKSLSYIQSLNPIRDHVMCGLRKEFFHMVDLKDLTENKENKKVTKVIIIE